MKNFFIKLLKGLVVLIIVIFVTYIILNLLMPLKYDSIEKCSNKKELVAEVDGIYIYSYCMNNIKVKNFLGMKTDFVDYINSHDNWYKKIKPLVSFPSNQDKYGTNYEGLNYKILKCKTKKNKNIYISPLYGYVDADCKKSDVPSNDVEGNVDVENIENN